MRYEVLERLSGRLIAIEGVDGAGKAYRDLVYRDMHWYVVDGEQSPEAVAADAADALAVLVDAATAIVVRQGAT